MDDELFDGKKELYEVLIDAKVLLENGVITFDEVGEYVNSVWDEETVFYYLLTGANLTTLRKFWKKEELVELFETTKNKFLKYSLARVKYDDVNYVNKLSFPELFSIDELEKCEETIQFSIGYFSLEERIKLFKRVDEFNLWDKLDLYNYYVHDYAEAIYKGCNSKSGWTWVAEMLMEHYTINLAKTQYIDVKKRFYTSKFKKFGLENHRVNFLLKRDIKLLDGLYFFNRFEYIRETLSFSIAFGIELNSNERKRANECIQEEPDVIDSFHELNLTTFSVTTDQLIEKFPEFFNK